MDDAIPQLPVVSHYCIVNHLYEIVTIDYYLTNRFYCRFELFGEKWEVIVLIVGSANEPSGGFALVLESSLFFS